MRIASICLQKNKLHTGKNFNEVIEVWQILKPVFKQLPFLTFFDNPYLSLNEYIKIECTNLNTVTLMY